MLRKIIYQNISKDLDSPFREIEMDETIFGGRRPDKHS
jgi:hypothetical protein